MLRSISVSRPAALPLVCLFCTVTVAAAATCLGEPFT
jgi:hypothetical protein|eukprot:COSAG06_NODE_4923_length_3856_cov_3.048177_5_plen_37_part_00